MHQSFIGKTDWFSENTEGKTDSNWAQICNYVQMQII